MLRRLLSHALISLAVVCLVATFYIWLLDNVLLNPSKLVPALKDAGVSAAIANILPEKATEDAKPDEREDMKAKISQVVTPDYVNEKLQAIAASVTTYMRQGTPQPIIDISDFPAKLRASGVEVGNDIDKNFAKPIELNKEGKLDKLPQAYKLLKLVKIAGLALFVVLLLLEWWVAARGEKLKRVGRVFLHSAVWFGLFFISIVVIPNMLAPKIKESINDANSNALVESVIKAVQKLFGQYVLAMFIACAVLAVSLYLMRHGKKHIQAIQETPLAKPARTIKTSKKS